ncbi:AGAP001482-PA [Anopheles gambiae str. PEST]|uniref:AGAP001482-PA n=1 Tax=Anopheles gambiae TaxID=7165 RepID=Q7PXM5_ANOGA|nr:AGAP001482-PA [Anopheles gambiae str. PEST]
MANNNSSDVKTAPGDGGGGGDDGGGGGGGGGGPGGGGSGGSDSAGGDNSEVNIRRGLDVIQSMIDISADRLEGLRTQCATSAELTQQEIRTLETKLVKLFSDLLITKSKLPERLPAQGLPATGNELKQWLRVVGLSCASLNAVIQQVSTLEGLLEKDEKELRTIMGNNVYVREEEMKRLTRACGNLRRCREHLELPATDGSVSRKGTEPHDLFWDSWDRQPACHRTSPRVNRSLGKCSKQSAVALAAAAASSYHHSSQQRHSNGPGMPGEAMGSTSNTSPQTDDGGGSLSLATTQHVEGAALLNPQHAISPDEASTSGCTPSPSPPNSPSNVQLHNRQNRRGFPTTPPPRKKHQTALLSFASGGGGGASSSASSVCSPATATVSSTVASTNSTTVTASSGASSGTAGGSATDANTALTKSKSHESHAGMLSETGGEYGGDPGVPPHPTGYSAVPPKSPCTPIITRGMGHMIQHRFTKKFKVTKSTCDLCNKQMFFGFKCTECKYRCHKDCKSNVPPSCGLPQEFVDEFKKSLQSDTLLPTSVSPNIGRGGGSAGGGGGGGGIMYGGGRGDAGKLSGGIGRGPMHAIHACGGGPDSSSAGSSCNSSSPSSPALLSLPPQTPATSKYSQFNFPEVSNSIGGSGGGGNGGSLMMMNYASSMGGGSSSGGITIETHPIGGGTGGAGGLGGSLGSSGVYTMDTSVEIPKLQFSDDHSVPGGGEDKTGSASATSTDSSSDRTPIRLDSTEERDHESSWPRQNSLSLKEWDIPYDDLHLKEKIGNGRFGTVHRALWHGDVAVKLLKEDYVADERTLEAFKLEVATFKKTRHENVVLFMGACMKPPRLAIVTSLCKGNTLFTHIHLRKDKFNLNRTTLVAQQISQGMGYLHARGIVHKDLKTKNIFLENGKVIITDFGLFSATKLLYCDLGLGIPGGWLCYLAPELMRNLTPYRPIEGDLPFSKTSDIYAFGTVWYELLCGEFPFKSQPAESIIWQVGRGMKQTLANLQASRDVKDILIQCWSHNSEDRPDFAKLLTQLERLPKKRLARSPSHPVQLSRSAESVF